ncbi:hypothetical protein ABZT04_41805 [Streptomyces sp. NPDC005492]|uniref:hypothetical protein n=1 Tax=Streptomyces sp. NPDC005492 TaxID=3156883 RepID=UPI0033AFA455
MRHPNIFHQHLIGAHQQHPAACEDAADRIVKTASNRPGPGQAAINGTGSTATPGSTEYAKVAIFALMVRILYTSRYEYGPG